MNSTKRPSPSKISKAIWNDEEKQQLIRQVREIQAKLKRPLRPSDLRRVKIRKRTPAAIKNQASRLGLYPKTRKVQRWNKREQHMLVVLGSERGLGAKGIKKRGFFTDPDESVKSWNDRSVDSIAQKKRREGYVDPVRSLRARIARHLSKEEQRKLRRDLQKSSRVKSTEDFSREYGVAPSTIRRYRKKWRIKYSWHVAMALPQAVERRKQLAEETRRRNVVLWRERKEKLLASLLKQKERAVGRAGSGGRGVAWRRCEKCDREWPATKKFFAPAPKRRNGQVVAVYLRRSCRVCPRR